MTTNTPTSGAADLPEALRLADAISNLLCSNEVAARTIAAAADEIVRLHALAAGQAVAPAEPDPTPGDHPPPCDSELFESGVSVGLFDIPKWTAEALCKGIAAATGARVDWHYIGGRVHVKALPASTATDGGEAPLPEPHFGEGRYLGLAFRSDAYSVAQVQALFASHGQVPAQAAHAAVGHDEDLLEKLYWEFDSQRKKTGEERLAFKVKMRFYASEFLRRSYGKMTFARSVSDDMMDLADRLGSEFDDVDPRAWKHLLVYAPKAAPADVAPPSAITASIMRDDGGEQPAPSPAPAEPDMRAVVAVAVTMLYESHPDDVLRTFTIAELAEIVRITAAMGSEQVEAIYKRAWDALSATTNTPTSGAADRAIEDCPELNMGNYDEVDVERLNDWAIRANDEIDRLHTQSEMRRAALLDEMQKAAQADSVLEDAARMERERICAAIKAEDDCIKIVRGERVPPYFSVGAARKQGEKQ